MQNPPQYNPAYAGCVGLLFATVGIIVFVLSVQAYRGRKSPFTICISLAGFLSCIFFLMCGFFLLLVG